CGPIPDTGATRTYNFHVSKETVAPDGVVKNGLVVNGQFPGPLIEANWGDWIEVIVTNDMSDEGTSLHWHGLLQKDTPWFDGVPSVSQCPIAPGDTLVYKFRADVFGSSWYHSHYSAQYAGGALGPIVIHGPKTQDYDVDLGPVMVSDWYHDDYFTLVNRTMNGIISFSNNILINGKMNYPCQNTTFACTPNAGVSKFSFTSGKKHLLRIINTSAEAMIKFSIDGHTMKVVANDFVPIQPYDTNVVTVGVGQRSDVIVEATGASTDLVWMRADATGCAFTDGVSPQGVAGVYYESANEDDVPSSTSSVAASALTDCGNDPLSQTQPFCPQTALDSNPTVQNIDITFGNNGTNFVWFMNNQSFHGDYNAPVLQQANEGNLTFPAEWNVFNFASAGSVRLILKSFFTAGAHPMHLHGHNFHVLDEGFGDWDGVITNPSNPQTRDVQLLRPAQDANTPSYIVMQWTQDNPGVWPMHCHIAWHVSGGLYINVLERPDDIQKMTIDHSVADTCQKWDAWSAANVVDQIDSGL
ncbi:laccase-1 precursor, partial [Trichodelitschia bisporula]